MPIYLSAQPIAQAIASVSGSRAKASALFDFLVIKRTFAIKGSPAVAITETEPAFIQALDEFGACGQYNGQNVKPDTAFYLNPFAARQSLRKATGRSATAPTARIPLSGVLNGGPSLRSVPMTLARPA